MKKIVIVEDIKQQADTLESLLLSVEENLKIYKTAYAEKAFEIAKAEEICLFIIDIQLKDYSGMDLARKIRDNGNHDLTPIIFITGNMSSDLFAFKTYHCYDYIIKPYSPENVIPLFRTVLSGIKGNEPVLKIKSRSFVFIVKLSEIQYIETINRKLTIHTDSDSYPINGKTLSEIHKMLPDEFLRIHNAYIINSKRIRKTNYSELCLYIEGNDKPVPISQKKLKDMRTKINDIL